MINRVGRFVNLGRYANNAMIAIGAGCVALIYIGILTVSTFLFSGDQRATFQGAIVVMMALQIYGLALLAPDLDHLRIRTALASNYPGVVTAAFGLGLGPKPSPLSSAQLSSVRSFLADHARVQHSIPPAVAWAVDIGLLVLGASMGAPFARAWAPPESSMLGIILVGAFAALLILVAVRFDRILNSCVTDATTSFGARALADPIRLLRGMPLQDLGFKNKLLADLTMAETIAHAPPTVANAATYFFAAPEFRWKPTNLADFSFSVGLFGAGLFLGAIMS